MAEEKKTSQENNEEKNKNITETKVENSADSKNLNQTDLKPGMTVRVYQKIKEVNIKGEEKERIQYFEGIIIAKKHNKEIGGTITVRKVSDSVGVEKIFPLNLPSIDKIEVKKIAKVSRAKLYFLRRGYKKRFKETVVK
ncbi:MAG TPA: 50S ribosomal protein L19 [Patescibacteria group bacterium]|nr:50S ribosomal protein L19 [Patescibacteria group bacterium]